MEREIVQIESEDFDYTNDSNGVNFNHQKQTYTVVGKERVDGDGEWWRVIVQRKSDGKFFEYQWGYVYGSGNYYFEGPLKEVFEKRETKTIEVITWN